MNDLIRTNNTLQINSKIDINMQELVSVGLAKMETRFTGKIKELLANVSELRITEKNCLKDINDICKSLIPADFIIMKTYLEGANFDDHSPKIISSYHEEQKQNHFILTLNINNSITNGDYQSRHSGVVLKSFNCPLNSNQLESFDQIKQILKTINKANKLIVKYRRRMNNINKLERQIKARIVEAQLLKTEDGTELLNSFMDSFEADIEAME